jgi:uncharacterized membrane protein
MHEASRGKLKIENLSDLVFGLALSLGSIILVSKSVATPFDLITNIVLFGFSFLIVIWIWSGYTRTISALPFENRWTFVLNVMLLFGVAIEPYLFYVLFQAPLSLLDFASSVYAVDGGAMMFILAGLAYLVVGEEKRQLKHEAPTAYPAGRFRTTINAEVASGIIFWASALPIFWVQDGFMSYLRFDMWYGVFVVFFLVFRLSRRRESGPASR